MTISTRSSPICAPCRRRSECVKQREKTWLAVIPDAAQRAAIRDPVITGRPSGAQIVRPVFTGSRVLLRSPGMTPEDDMNGRFQRLRPAARLIGALAAAALLLPSLARAEYPDRPIRLVIPFPAGGATDILGRSVADFLGKELKQPIIVENKPGANTTVAADLVAHAPPDGYTLLVAAASTLVLNPLLYKKPTIDVKAFRPLSIMVEIPLIMVVNKSVPAQSVAEFIAYTKSNLGKVNYASSGAGGPLHLAGELFNISAGVDMTHVPYRGSAPALTDLISGQVQVMFDPVSSSLGHVRGGSLRPHGRARESTR